MCLSKLALLDNGQCRLRSACTFNPSYQALHRLAESYSLFAKASLYLFARTWGSILQLLHLYTLINPFPHIDAFRRICSRRLFENIVTKEENAQNKQFLLLKQCFPLFVIGYPFNYRNFPFFYKICSKSSAAELSYEGKG